MTKKGADKATPEAPVAAPGLKTITTGVKTITPAEAVAILEKLSREQRTARKAEFVKVPEPAPAEKEKLIDSTQAPVAEAHKALSGARPGQAKACSGHKYRRLITPLDGGPPVVVDVYSVLQAFGVTCQARGHAIKKALLPGARGDKSVRQDLEEAIVALRRSIDFTPPEAKAEVLGTWEVSMSMQEAT